MKCQESFKKPYLGLEKIILLFFNILVAINYNHLPGQYKSKITIERSGCIFLMFPLLFLHS